MESLRIAMLTPYFKPVMGGITSYVGGLSGGLRTRGAEVFIVARQAQPSEGVEVIPVDSHAFVHASAQTVVRFRPDIIHAHSHWYLLAAALQARVALPNTKVVFSFHTPWTAIALRRWAGLVRESDVTTCPSKEMFARVLKHVEGRDRLRVVHPAVDVSEPSQQEIERWTTSVGIPEGAPVLVFAGGLHFRRKVRGVRDLVRAAASLRHHYSGLRLVVLGDGRYRPALEALSARLAPGLTLFAGFVPQPWIAMRRATLYTHISYIEGLPLSVLEAMGLARCVVASRVGGIPEAIDHGLDGILVDGPSASLPVLLEGLLGDSTRANAIGYRAREKILRDYSWRRRADDWLQTYRGA